MVSSGWAEVDGAGCRVLGPGAGLLGFDMEVLELAVVLLVVWSVLSEFRELVASPDPPFK